MATTIDKACICRRYTMYFKVSKIGITKIIDTSGAICIRQMTELKDAFYYNIQKLHSHSKIYD